MWEVKRIFDPQFLLNPGVILNEDPEVHSKNIRLDFPVPSLYLPCTFHRCTPRISGSTSLPTIWWAEIAIHIRPRRGRLRTAGTFS